MSATPYARSASEANLTRRQDRQEAVAATRFCAPHIFQAIIRVSPGGASARLQEPRRWQRWTAMSGITTCAEIAIVQVLTLFKLGAGVVQLSQNVSRVSFTQGAWAWGRSGRRSHCRSRDCTGAVFSNTTRLLDLHLRGCVLMAGSVLQRSALARGRLDAKYRTERLRPPWRVLRTNVCSSSRRP